MARGQSLIEMAVILPVLLLLILGTVDFGHALYMASCSNRVSREGANLAARGTGVTPEQLNRILDTLEETFNPPLDLSQQGCIYISVLRAEDHTARRDQQYHRCAAGFTPDSKVLPVMTEPAQQRLFNGRTLHPEEQVVIVEVFYRYGPLTPVARFGVRWGADDTLTLNSMATFFLIARAAGDV